MKKGQEITGKVIELKYPNIGVVETDEGERVVVKNSLPGQKVRARINKLRHGKAEGSLLEVTEKSPSETGESCPHFGKCGGCGRIYAEVPCSTGIATRWSLPSGTNIWEGLLPWVCINETVIMTL